MSYSYTILGLDDEGNVILEHNISADVAMRIIAGALKDLQSSDRVEIAGGGPEVVVALPGKKKKAKEAKAPKEKKDTGKRTVTCKNCGGSGHIAKTCPNGAGRQIVPPAAATTLAITEEAYDEIREAMHDREFQSARYALTNSISPREVNAAVRSTSYKNYLEIRV